MEKRLKILILEDSADDVELIERELKKGEIDFSSSIARNRPEFEEALRRFTPDVVLADHSLPDFNSIEALEIFRAHKRNGALSGPFILVSGTVPEDFLIRSMQSGVDDYIQKDQLKRLPSAIRTALERSRIEGVKMEYFRQVEAREALMKEGEALAHLGSWSADLLTGKYTWSDETYRIYGYEPHEITPDYEVFLKHVHPKDRDFFEEARQHVLNKFDSYANEFRIIDRRGSIRYISSRILVKRDADKRPVALVGFSLDVTDKKESEKELQKREQEYRAIFDQHPDPAFCLDLEGNFTRVNRSFAALTGLSEIKLLGMSFASLFDAARAGNVEQHFQAALAGNHQRFEAHLSDAVLEITTIPIVIENEITGIQGIGRAMTRRPA